MNSFVFSCIVFCFIYLLYEITVVHNSKKMSTFEKSGQASFIIKKYNLNIKKRNKKKFARMIAFTNSFILAFTFFITDLISNFILKLLVGFILLIPLILVGYSLIGKYYKKKEGK